MCTACCQGAEFYINPLNIRCWSGSGTAQSDLWRYRANTNFYLNVYIRTHLSFCSHPRSQPPAPPTLLPTFTHIQKYENMYQPPLSPTCTLYLLRKDWPATGRPCGLTQMYQIPAEGRAGLGKGRSRSGGVITRKIKQR